VSRRGSISDIADWADVTRPFCPGGSTHVEIRPARCLRQFSL
jgi:hypothetical protein